MLMEEVSNEEIKETLASFKIDKNPRPNGWPVEYIIALYGLLQQDLINVVNEVKELEKF